MGGIILITGCGITAKSYSSKSTKEKISTYHIVRKGENLFRISMYYYDVSTISEVKKGVEKIKKFNNLKSEQLYVGQKLAIPETKKKQPNYALTSVEKIPPSTPTKKISQKQLYISEQKPQPEPEEKPPPIIKESMFIWPVKGKIICRYGELGNKGIDILVKSEDEVIASANGKVSFIGSTTKYGDTIIIEHQDNFYTVYGHDLDIKVKKEQVVKKGEIIGKIKSDPTKIQKQRYLHFEVRKGTESFDPLFYLPALEDEKQD